MEKALFIWSGGKDSAMALYEVLRSRDHDIVALATTITEDYDRISMHGVRKTLLEAQACALGIPLEKVFISKTSSNDGYESKMQSLLERHVRRGVSASVFGDIFLEDLRKYREDNLAQVGMKAIFPIWKRASGELAREFIGLGFKAVVTCVDSWVLDKKFAGRDFDEDFISGLPEGVDPCGENGEFHSFVYDGPIFRNEVPFRRGDVVLRDKRYYYCDLMPA